MNNIKITNEQEAFDLIQKALKDELGDHLNITFENWPRLTITLEGDGYAGTITPSMMEALVEFQAGINRTYARVVYNQTDSRHLKAEERQDLEFKAKVEEGCTKIDIDLTEIMKKTVEVLGAKMEGKHVVALGVAGMALWATTSSIKSHYDAVIKTKEVQEETVKATTLSQEETKRMQIMADALRQQPVLADIQKDANDSRISLLKGISDADSIEINGITFTKKDAKVIASTKRSTSNEIQINGNYKILEVNTTLPDEIKIKVKHIDDGKEFWAKFRDQSLDQKQIGILQQAEWKREKVYLSVNATELRGQITTATIISVTEQPSI